MTVLKPVHSTNPMRLDNPKYVVVLGMITTGIFFTVLLFSFVLFPAISSEGLFGFPFTLYPENSYQYQSVDYPDSGTNTGGYNNNSPSAPTSPQSPSPAAYNPPQIVIPTLPEKLESKVELDQNQINQLVKVAAGGNKFFANPHISLNGDTATLTADILSPIKGKFSASMLVSPGNDAVNIKLTEAKINNFPVPSFLLLTLEGELNSIVNGSLSSIPLLTIEKVYVANSKLVIEGSIPTQSLFNFLNQGR